MDNEQTAWLLDSLKDYLGDKKFFGKIELNIQNGQIIVVNITRGIRPPVKN